MVKKRLMLGAAFAALGLIPLSAQAQEGGNELIDDYDLDVTADWDNDVDVELDWEVEVEKELSIFGSISIDGSVTAEALSHATLDDKQFVSGNDVDFEDYQNAYQNEPSMNNDNEPGLGTTTGSPNYTEEGLASGPAAYSNTIVSTSSASAASGNVGINLAAGDYNLQENAAVISNADGFFPAETETATNSFALSGARAFDKSISASGAVEFIVTEQSGSVTTTEALTASASVTLALSGSASFSITGTSSSATGRSARTAGAAEAGNFSLQSLYDNGFNTQSFELENTEVDNNVSVTGALSAADGNLGLNAAAGAFNIQKNALVIASVTGGHLAEAASAVIQHSEGNASVIEDVTNNVNFASSLTNATGNIGVNLAAGVGNLQLNSLTIANALAGAPVDTGTGPGGSGTGPGGGSGTGGG
jgi:hypothetical protein